MNNNMKITPRRLIVVFVTITSILILSYNSELLGNDVFLLILFAFLNTLVFVRFKVPKHIKILLLALSFIKVLILYGINDHDYFLSFFPDSLNYYKNIQTINEKSIANLIEGAGTLHVGFYLIYIRIFNFFQYNWKSLYLFNFILISLSSLYYYKVFVNIDDNKNSSLITIFYSSSYTISLFGSLLLKDPIIIYLVSLYMFLIFVKNQKLFGLGIGIITTLFRIYTGISMIIAVLYLLYKDRQKQIRFNFKKIVIILFLLYVFLSNTYTRLYVNLIYSKMRSISLWKVVYSIILGIGKYFLSPFPLNLLRDWTIYSPLFFETLIVFTIFVIFVFKIIVDREFRKKSYYKLINKKDLITFFLILILFNTVPLFIEYGRISPRQSSPIYFIKIYFIILFFNLLTMKEEYYES